MLKYINYNIVFQEVPDEVSLAVNISNCPNRCKGCHSPYLLEDTGELLNKERLACLIAKYENAITCICFMGGDSEPENVERLAVFIRESTSKLLKVAWYSGKQNLPESCSLHNFDYIKLGSYMEELGGLDSPNTNQRLYKISNGKMIEITNLFIKQL
jgi:anaerobic ribonucleoside-triphosphate reductase activating protein